MFPRVGANCGPEVVNESGRGLATRRSASPSCPHAKHNTPAGRPWAGGGVGGGVHCPLLQITTI